MVKYGVLFEVRTEFLNIVKWMFENSQLPYTHSWNSVLKLSLQDSKLQQILQWFQSIGCHTTNTLLWIKLRTSASDKYQSAETDNELRTLI
jgi:hypothetical protein